jgi:hypothetical protein
VFEGDAAEVRKVNQERLTQADAVMVFYGSGTEAWKASVDADIRRATALRAGRPLHGVLTWLADLQLRALSARARRKCRHEPNRK